MRRIFACQSWDKSSLTEAQATARQRVRHKCRAVHEHARFAARNRFGDFCEVIAAASVV